MNNATQNSVFIAFQTNDDTRPIIEAIGNDNPKRSEEHTSELQSRLHVVCRLLLEKKMGSSSISVLRRGTTSHSIYTGGAWCGHKARSGFRSRLLGFYQCSSCAGATHA